MSIRNRKVKPKAAPAMDLLTSLTYHPGRDPMNYNSHFNQNHMSQRRLVVKGHKVDWEDRPEAPGDVTRFEDGPSGMDGYVSFLQRRAYHSDWPPVDWKAFKKLVRKGYLHEVWPGFWALTPEGERAAREYRNRTYFREGRHTVYRQGYARSRYRKIKQKEADRKARFASDVEQPSPEEARLFARGYVSKAVAKYAERLGITHNNRSNIRFAFDWEGFEAPSDREHRYRRGWAERVAQREINRKYTYVEG